MVNDSIFHIDTEIVGKVKTWKERFDEALINKENIEEVASNYQIALEELKVELAKTPWNFPDLGFSSDHSIRRDLLEERGDEIENELKKNQHSQIEQLKGDSSI